MLKIKYFILLGFIYLIVGCATQENYLIEDINFNDYQSITIDASRLIIEQKYNTNITSPFIDHLVKQNLVSLVNYWSIARLNTVSFNNKGNLKVIINEASIKALPLSANNNVEDLFMSNSAINIEMNLDITIDLLNQKNEKISYVNIKVLNANERKILTVEIRKIIN